MQVNVLTAEGPILDYLVSTALGYVLEAPDGLARQLWMVQKSDGPQLLAFPIWPDDHTHRYSTDWARGGWLVDNHIVSLDQNGTGDVWTALAWCADRSLQRADGPTALIAVARCFAASRLGEWARVPECLIPQPEVPAAHRALTAAIARAAEDSVPAPQHLTAEQIEKVDGAIAEALGDAYDCTRVWNAWSCGTMGPSDFVQVADDGERIAEIRNAVLQALGPKAEG